MQLLGLGVLSVRATSSGFLFVGVRAAFDFEELEGEGVRVAAVEVFGEDV